MDASVTTAHRLFVRAAETDGPTRSLSGGAIAGIIIGIVIVFALLAALLVWRMYTYKTNRDFFNGRPNRLFPSQLRQRGHIRSTRRHLSHEHNEHNDSVIDMHAEDADEKHLHSGAAPAHSHVDLGEQNEYNGESSYLKSHESRYPSETNRASWWWRPQHAAPEEIQTEIMQSDHSHQPHQGPSSVVGNVNDAYDEDPHAYQPDPIAAHPAVFEAEQTTAQHDNSRTPPRASFRQGCTTQ